LWWALPLLTVSWLVLLTVVVSGVMRIERWETAPGTVSAVGPRLEFVDPSGEVQRYPAGNSVNFVTAYGSQLSALESFIGWVDTDVDVQTKTERFGKSTPSEQRTLGYQAMVGAKQIAEYVAFKRLGYDATLEYGPVVVEQLICLPEPTPDSACNRLRLGDVLESVDGTPTPTLQQLVPLMEGREVGEVLEIVVHELDANPNDTRRTERVRLIASPDNAQRAIIGFVPADTRTVDVPFQVNIDTDTIGGPSAGLAFTLALLDELTPGDLMGNVKVASTGTISEDETVGVIGALRQKAVAAAGAGADVFLVPAGQTPEEIAEARRIVGDDLEIVPVANLTEALETLATFGGGELPS
jgi:PDZ domain-containing protein